MRKGGIPFCCPSGVSMHQNIKGLPGATGQQGQRQRNVVAAQQSSSSGRLRRKHDHVEDTPCGASQQRRREIEGRTLDGQRQATKSMACVSCRLDGPPETKGIGYEMHVSSLRVAQQKVGLHEAP